ncbi:unnamed protein product [Blepharisma stoltei]|uniref:Uncharacterized protein n=1 Tax=Blepharisma stoltei TaxID=1481888 RepID=A0AAU9ISQ5_9CILI|nr:unnamed protein product [Blepharisma stoltei]
MSYPQIMISWADLQAVDRLDVTAIMMPSASMATLLPLNSLLLFQLFAENRNSYYKSYQFFKSKKLNFFNFQKILWIFLIILND